ncbi:MAG: hypothetical protein H6638_11705 [Ardenticatenales bacterium]|nr:hypothetical protein [Ardenticatenales bacterium]
MSSRVGPPCPTAGRRARPQAAVPDRGRRADAGRRARPRPPCPTAGRRA